METYKTISKIQFEDDDKTLDLLFGETTDAELWINYYYNIVYDFYDIE